MKRTAEITLGIIALALQLLIIILLVTFMAFFNFQFPEMLSTKFVPWYAWFVVAIHLVGFIFGVIALILLKDKPKTSGIVLVATSIVMLILTLGATIIQSVLFIISGIMCLAKNPASKRLTSKHV
ncbi:DUF4064 domain-containing protein [Gracilibacillus halophilus]|uniref:DUF4064 domain-containing protein n=1 Tax=Gracilibacillus halophilus TaxID=470864 RepID=UPI0003A9CE16|nr:DUF4064 domain-containing protein [Gracilibacillus halophilus]